MQIGWNILSKYRNEIYGISILWIILFHVINLKYTALSKELKALNGLMHHGNIGVEIFLFMSGISLYYSMKNYQDVYSFYKKRLIRIYTPLLLIYGSYCMYTCIIKNNDILQLIKNITFYSFWFEGNSAVWFIALIIPLYLLYPLIFKFILENKSINRFFYIVLMCIGIYIFCYVLKVLDPSYFKNIEIALTRIPIFLLGCYCGILCYDGKLITKKIKLFSYLLLIYGIGYFHTSGIYFFRIPYFILTPCFVIWISVALKIISCDFLNKHLFKTGGLSLELYLSHVILIWTIREFYNSPLFGSSNVANFHKCLIIVLTISFFISNAVKLIEKKMLKI